MRFGQLLHTDSEAGSHLASEAPSGRSWCRRLQMPHACAFAGRAAICLYVSRTAIAAAAIIGPAMGTE
jgi:hypothetical protein